MRQQIPSKVIDEPTDDYVEWREACAALHKTYQRWLSVRVAERERAFAEYRAALDCEEQASALYEDRVKRVARKLLAARLPVVAAR